MTLGLMLLFDIVVWVCSMWAPEFDSAVKRYTLQLALLLVVPVGQFLIIKARLGITFGKGLLVFFSWLLLAAAYAVGVVLSIPRWVGQPFIVPTGSMASAVLGYHKDVTCPKCGHVFAVNSSVEGEEGVPIVACTCENCRYYIDFKSEHMHPALQGGDRVAVGKGLLGAQRLRPARFDVIAYVDPRSERQKEGRLSYVKRVIGLPGESIIIHYGKLYVLGPGNSSGQHGDSGVASLDPYETAHMYEHASRDWWNNDNTPFQIVRKSPDKILSVRRLVYDNDHPAKDQAGIAWRRWLSPTPGWAAGPHHIFDHGGHDSSGIDWLRYRHVPRPENQNPQLITDFFGYNTAVQEWTEPGDLSGPRNWVGDLMIECEVLMNKPEGELVLELSKGVDRFRARWDLAAVDGKCQLIRGAGGHEQRLEERPTSLRPGTAHSIRFANVDDRLLVWVDNDLPFGEGVVYRAASEQGPYANDLEPASIGCSARAAISVRHLQLWRDNYYTLTAGGDPEYADYASVQPGKRGEDLVKVFSNPATWSDPAYWEPLRRLRGKRFFVPPGHYFLLGDNSPHSSDSRSLGPVPDRLMLGKAWLIYYPFSRAGEFR